MIDPLVTLLLAATGAVAQADPATLLPFVDERGMVAKALTYADLERTLGVPPAAQVRPEGWATRYPQMSLGVGRSTQGERVRTGGELDLAYPALGLRFSVDRDDRPLKDPPIRLMTITAEAAGRTPQGLFVGQPQANVLGIARGHYKVLQERLDGDRGTLELTDAAGRSRQRLWLELRHGALYQMQFDFKPPPTPLQRAFAPILLVAGVGLSAWWFARVRRAGPAGPVASDRIAALVGRLIVWGGIATGAAALGGLGLATVLLLGAGGNPYGALGGLAVGYYAGVGLLLAVLLVVVGRAIVRRA